MNEAINWEDEVQGVIADISNCVSQITLSERLNTVTGVSQSIYLNLETFESEKFTVKLSSAGYSIVGTAFNDNTLEDNSTSSSSYETVYALLQSVSPLYVSTFAEKLSSKLEGIATAIGVNEQDGD